MTSVSSKVLEAKPHTAVYKMHKYFARRPWNVFADFVSRFTTEGEIVLDPFCGGGVTVVEALKLRRKVVGVDVNPIATYVTSMECTPANLDELRSGFDELSERVGNELSSLYLASCGKCHSQAVADWLEWDEKTKRIKRLKSDCPKCGPVERPATLRDQRNVKAIEQNFEKQVRERKLWFPTTQIPKGDKTSSLLAQGFTSFQDLYTRRNLLAISILRKEIANERSSSTRDLLYFTLSSSLKWASRLSHLRGKIIEGWAMHAYWVYPRSLELNVWNVFKRRYAAVYNGKKYVNEHIGTYCRPARQFNELVDRDGTCFILTQDASHLPIPNDSIDAIITDPPYGGNVNYSELSDFWYVWMNNGRLIDKKAEAVINRTQGKALEDYEALLEVIFRECFRVLKPGKSFVSTFNSNDFRVVASFIVAAIRSGFSLLPEDVQYQTPIRPYMTTFHAMQIGAFVGDFVFEFKKDVLQSKATPKELEFQSLKSDLSQLVSATASRSRPEPKLREQAYGLLIPFLAKYAVTHETTCREAADFFESEFREYESYFRSTRKRLTLMRRRAYLHQ